MKLPFDSFQVEQDHGNLPQEIAWTPTIRARTKGLLFKLETLQPTGSYKIRAAYLKLAKIAQRLPGAQVALSSSGNFAAAFTWAAARLGLQPHLVLTGQVVERKLELAQQYPCRIHRCEDRFEARFEKLEELKESGVVSIDHRQDLEVYLGHATIGYELGKEGPAFHRILLPISTGGLAIGVAAALRNFGFRGEILGVQAAGNPTVFESWRLGEAVSRESIATCCDALTATSITPQAFAWLQHLLDGVLVVQESTIGQAVAYLAYEEGLVVEPGGAVGMAALLEEQRPAPGTLLVLTGSNIEAELLASALTDS